MATTKVRLTDLVEDYDLYPRHAVDGSYVAELARAITAGDKLPSPIVERKSKRIVDGFHRVRAYRKVLGRGGEITVEMRTYPSETELLKEAIALNATHGRKFDAQDKTRSALMLERAGVPVTEIKVVLHTTEERVRELLARVVIVKPEKENAAPEKWPAKPVIYPGKGQPPREITEQQHSVMESSSGHRTAQTVTQLTREIESGLIDFTAPGVAEKLWKLHDSIEATVPAVAA
jgi:hypothetical protein